MDLREVVYIIHRPDHFPEITLKHIQGFLQLTSASAVALIGRVLETGYVKIPKEYEGDRYFHVNLSEDERIHVFEAFKDTEAFLNERATKEPTEKNDRKLASLRQLLGYWERLMTEQPLTYAQAKSNFRYYDLRKATLDDFEAFIFDHDVPENSDEAWYWDRNLLINHSHKRDAELYIQLFSNADRLLDRYTSDQLEQGFWGIKGSLDISLTGLIWGRSLDIELKENLIHSIYFLYEKFFSINPLKHSCHMFWDSLAYDINPMKRVDPVNNSEHRRIQDAMFLALRRILSLDSEDCQFAALHGMNHVMHPDSEEVILSFLRTHKDLNEEIIDYARICIKGEAL